MRKITVSLISTALLLPLAVLADAPDVVPTVDIMDVLDNITNWLFAVLLVIAAIFIIIAGYMFVTAMGDPDKTKTARNFVMYALIGVLVGFCAKGLVLLVRSVVGA